MICTEWRPEPDDGEEHRPVPYVTCCAYCGALYCGETEEEGLGAEPCPATGSGAHRFRWGT